MPTVTVTGTDREGHATAATATYAVGNGTVVTDGSQLAGAPTTLLGYLAYVGPQGQRYTDATLVVHNNRVTASSLGGSATGHWFKAGIQIDAPLTLTACRYDNDEIYTNGFTTVLNYVTVNSTPLSTHGIALAGANHTATRCIIRGNSDGVREDNSMIVECFIGVTRKDASDHNDAVQAYQASAGGTFLRCYIDGTPTNASGGNSAVFFADNSHGVTTIRDTYLRGGGYTARFHESQQYRLTNITIEKGSWIYGALSTTNSIAGAFLEWSNVHLSDGTQLPHP